MSKIFRIKTKYYKFINEESASGISFLYFPYSEKVFNVDKNFIPFLDLSNYGAKNSKCLPYCFAQRTTHRIIDDYSENKSIILYLISVMILFRQNYIKLSEK